MMRKVIKIFLGSSIVEFERERETIENFIYRISRNFEKNYNVSVEPLLCENFDDAYSKIRKQEEYNEKVKESDLCFFIFFTKVGEYTREEFEVARKKFNESGKPKIYTYFKVLGDKIAEDSLYTFMEELEKVFGHYYGFFEHIDTIKLRILLNLKLQEMDFLEIKADGDDCLVGGLKALSLKNVSEFANNSIFNELKKELQEVEPKYYSLKAKAVGGKCSYGEEREYVEIASKRQNLIDAIEEMQKNIFNMSLRMCQDEARGEITLRQKEAYRLFEAGDLEGANNILDFSEIKNEYQRRKEIRKAEQKKEARIFIREGRTKIDILTMMSGLATRFQEIEEIYDEITDVALDECVEIDTVTDFVCFLHTQNNHQKAYQIAKALETLIADGMDSETEATIYNLLGTICSDFISLKNEVETYYKKAIDIREKLAEINPERFNSALADSYNDIALFYNDQGQQGETEEYYTKAMAIYEKLAEINPESFNPDLANSYNNIGLFYNNQGQARKAEEYYIKGIVIREKLAETNPERFNPGLANSYNNIGVLYKNQGQMIKAEKYYNKTTTMYEKLAEVNPERFNPDLASSYNNNGIFYNNQGQSRKAEEYFNRAIAIREKLAETNPERFNSNLADSCNNMAIFYSTQGQPRKAEEYFTKAMEIYEELAEINPERFNPYLANGYNNIGVLYKNQGQLIKAEKFYTKAIAIREKLIEINPERFNFGLAESYNNIGVFYNKQGQPRKAEECFNKAMVIYEELAEINPERFNPYLANGYNNIGVLYKNQGQLIKAEKFYTKAIAIREKLAEANPEIFTPDLAVSYFNYAVFSKKDTYLEKALELAEACPGNEYCQMIISACKQEQDD